MAVLLRRFNFFDKEVVKDPETNQVFEKLKDINISSCASGRGQIVIADCEGTVYMINRKFQITSFKAYDIRVSHLYQLKQFNILLTVGEDEEGVNPLIKVWNLDKFEKGTPVCSRICRAIPSNKPTPVTCLTVHENLNWMAVGFENGSVVIFKGDVKSDRHSKTWTVYENQKPITGLAFRPTGKNIILFVATDNCILSINLSARDKTTTLEQFGCNLGCSVMSDSNQDHQFVIGRQDGVYFYQPDCRGPCVVIEGEKLRLEWFRGYLIIVGKECKPLLKAPVSSHSLEMHTVTVYDMQNKFVAHTAPYPDVIDVLSEWGSLYVLSGDRKLYQLQEKDTQTKLEMLFKKNNYTLAISLARSQQYDQEGLIDIFTQYGDHLYGKGDHDGAIDQYIKTIGKLEASYVIRKFLDSQRIHNLTKYLQALHKAQMATEEHTTLLLNCYTKLKDVSKLDEFIMTKDREVDFDVETAIKVCRQAGYYEHALFLAEKHEKHEWYLRIQLEKIKDYQKALEYIGNLEFAEADDNLKKYGKMLMSEIPDQTTELLKKLCTDYRPSNRLLVDQSDLDGSVPRIQKASAEEFIHIFVNNSAKLTEFLEYMIKTKPNSPSLLYNTLLELYLHDIVHEGEDIEAKNEKQRRTLDLLQNPDANYDLDQALVLCQMNNFKAGILFLYEKAQLYQQILRYHMEHSENVHVIETCKKFGQHDPQLWVQALSYFAKKEESCKPQLMEVLSNIDKRNLLPPLLVIETLAHNSTATLSIIKDYIIRRLQLENDQIAEDERLIKQYREDTEKKRKQIEELKTTWPIVKQKREVVGSTLGRVIPKNYKNGTNSCLAWRSALRVGFLPGFDMSKLAKLESLFSPPCLTEAAIFHELQFMIMLTPACIAKAKIFQNSKCSICSHPLELPSVHFLCEPHSFHQQCLESYAENDTECPVCLPENRKIMDIIRAQEQSKDLHESFHNQLERSQDGFSVVADYFGRGVFNKVTVITDSNARFSASPPGRNLSSQFS